MLILLERLSSLWRLLWQCRPKTLPQPYAIARNGDLGCTGPAAAGGRTGAEGLLGRDEIFRRRRLAPDISTPYFAGGSLQPRWRLYTRSRIYANRHIRSTRY